MKNAEMGAGDPVQTNVSTVSITDTEACACTTVASQCCFQSHLIPSNVLIVLLNATAAVLDL